MKKYNKLIGNYGEDICTEKLISLGYDILHRNFKCRFGEIDIVAKKQDIISFIEIKSRFSNSYGAPLEAVTYLKTHRIINAAKYYILINGYMNLNVRFDIMEVNFNYKDKKYMLNIIEDAFRL